MARAQRRRGRRRVGYRALGEGPRAEWGGKRRLRRRWGRVRVGRHERRMGEGARSSEVKKGGAGNAGGGEEELRRGSWRR